MSAQQLKAVRTRAGLTQAEMAKAIGLALSAYCELETEVSQFRLRHQLMLERLSLRLAVERKDLTLALAAVREDAIGVAQLVRRTTR